MPEKFPDYAPPTKIAYLDGRPSELHVRKCIFVWKEGNETKEATFDQNIVTIGAMEDNDLVLNHETVSRYHCKVIQEHNGYVLVDLDSTNGTFVNRVRIREAYLRPGCTVQVGQVELEFRFADEKLEIVPSPKERLGGMIGKSVKMREIYGIVEKIAPTGTTVVIEGETGTGKEVVAQAIHQLSKRSKKPMIVVDCSAVPENLIESELFGHEKGSFTGAIMTRQGLFELAHESTIFLDEIGELTLDLQPKLLRALEQREIRRVGSGKGLKVDVRVVAATNRSLDEEVRAGRFRQDLFYRLSVVRICLPPLRDRIEDIPLLVEHFLRNHPSIRNPDTASTLDTVDPEALEMLCEYRWPGNVRELFNVLERVLPFSKDGKIRPEDLPESVRLSKPLIDAITAQGNVSFKDAKEHWITTFERDYIESLLRKNNGNISHAAREADVDRKYFRKLMRKYAIISDDLVDEPSQ
ncbi:MAG: sigma 54-interacting transcriptional regulator [Pseudomonadota bacterium]